MKREQTVKRVFICLPSFWNDWIVAGLTDYELEILETYLLRDPNSGAVVRETAGIRKIRFAKPGKGKSSGVRVFYLDVKAKGKLYFLAVIQKNEEENLSKSDRNELAALVRILKE
jgi:hypothetical protein